MGWSPSHRTVHADAVVFGDAVVLGWVVWWWVCPYFENCTVDASIFVAKLVRAHGGCLGIRSR
jgi:hypothetical protein